MLKISLWKNLCQANINHKADVAILILKSTLNQDILPRIKIKQS